MPFFNTLNYSSCNEDGRAELRALAVSRRDCVFCITGSGDRVLHMLLGDPDQVIAVDCNPVQNHLLELKMAAIRALSYDEYVRFLGLHPAQRRRLQVYLDLRPLLSPDAAAWFDAHRAIVERGVLYAGRWERYFRFSARNLRLLRGRKIKQLLAFHDLQAQQKFLRDKWNTWGWRFLLRLTFNRVAFRFFLGDPGFYSHPGTSMLPWRYIYNRMTSFLEHHLARSSFMIALVFYGRFFDPAHYPPYLQEAQFPLLKARLDRIQIRTLALFEALQHRDFAACNKYSLSDVSSFLSGDDYARLFDFFASRPKVRFCLRDFLTHRTVPLQTATCLRYLPGLQDELARDDTSLGYTFLIGSTE